MAVGVWATLAAAPAHSASTAIDPAFPTGRVFILTWMLAGDISALPDMIFHEVKGFGTDNPALSAGF
jgi:hypothetical protein